MRFQRLLCILALIIALTNPALAKLSPTREQPQYKYHYAFTNACNEVYDPYENTNRKIFMFNSVLDYFLLRPIAVGYQGVTNDYVKARVGNVLDNINTPLTTVNYGLQLNFDKALNSFWKFVINTTFGIGGLFNIAGKVNLQVKPQTFGSTLAHYGVATGPYLVIPFFGSSNARDITDIFGNNALNPVKYQMHGNLKLGITIVKTVHDRAIILPFTDYITKHSPDPYVAIRSSTHQNREAKVSYPKNFVCPVVKNISN